MFLIFEMYGKVNMASPIGPKSLLTNQRSTYFLIKFSPRWVISNPYLGMLSSVDFLFNGDLQPYS